MVYESDHERRVTYLRVDEPAPVAFEGASTSRSMSGTEHDRIHATMVY
jgi:hypothetical protein